MPKPFRIRLYHPHNDRQVVGHWFVRPIQLDQPEGWKLSFWHPEYSWKGRRAEKGHGYDQAMYLFVSTLYDLADARTRAHVEELSALDAQIALEDRQAIPPPRGFRRGHRRIHRRRVANEYQAWKSQFEASCANYCELAFVRCGWPEVVLPAMPWQETSD